MAQAAVVELFLEAEESALVEESYIEVIENKRQPDVRKVKVLADQLVYIGPQTGQGIALSDPAPLGKDGRLLVRPAGDGEAGYVLTNLSKQPVQLMPQHITVARLARPLLYGESIPLVDQDRVEFGDAYLVYWACAQTSVNLRIEIDLPNRHLYPFQPLKGKVMIFCTTGQTIQPTVKIVGNVKSKVYPAPQLSTISTGVPIEFDLFHPESVLPPPGKERLRFEVRALNTFPNEVAMRTQEIWLEAYPQHQIQLTPHARLSTRLPWRERAANWFSNRYRAVVNVRRTHPIAPGL